MRTPRSAAPVFAASKAAVFVPSAMAVKISNSIAVFSAALCWKALRVLKMCSGLGRLVAVEVAMDELSCRVGSEATDYIRGFPQNAFFRRQANCRKAVPTGILSSPRNNQEGDRCNANITAGTLTGLA